MRLLAVGNRCNRVIIVTDGDSTAQRAIQTAVRDLGLYLVKMSGGNPTPISGPEVMELILTAPCEPVVVMADDRGDKGLGNGEQVMEYLLEHQEQIEVIGVVAVASETRVWGIEVDFSVNLDGEVVAGPVKKNGQEERPGAKRLEGDTVGILQRYPELLIVGCGDIGKMAGRDAVEDGAFVTSRCLQEIIERSSKCSHLAGRQL